MTDANQTEPVRSEPVESEPFDETDFQAQPEVPPTTTGDKVDEPEPEKPVDPIDARLKGLETAIAEERSKRQAAERDLDYFRGQLDARQTQQQAPKPEIDWSEEDKRFWENPAQYTHQVTMTRAQEIAAQAMATRDRRVLDASASRVSRQHEDYLDKEAVFIQHARQNPKLWEHILSHPEPAQAMYDMVSQYQQQQQAMGPDWEAKKEAEIRARVEAEMKQERAKRAVAGAPTTQAGVRGTGVAQVPSGGDPFDEIVRY